MSSGTITGEKPGELREMPGKIAGERASARGPEIENEDLADVNLSGAAIGGLTVSTLVTLVLIPVLYTMFCFGRDGRTLVHRVETFVGAIA